MIRMAPRRERMRISAVCAGHPASLTHASTGLKSRNKKWLLAEERSKCGHSALLGYDIFLIREVMGLSDKQVTQLVEELEGGDALAAEELVPLVYTELRGMAAAFLRREGMAHTLQPTAMVHEAFMRLVDQTRVEWKGRAHFVAVAAQTMRRILVDHARAKKASKRGGNRVRVALQSDIAISPERDEDVLALNEALEKLQEIDERQARIVELRFFGGLTVREVAEVLDVSTRTVENDWTMVRAWLRRELDAGEADD